MSPSTSPLPFGSAVRLVARREITQRLRDRSFLVSTAITLFILAAVIVVPPLLAGDGVQRVAFADDVSEPDALWSATHAQADQLGVELERHDPVDRAAAERLLTDGELDVYVTADELVVHEDLDSRLGAALQGAHRALVGAERLADAGLDQDQIAEAMAVPELGVDALEPSDPQDDQRGLIALIATVILYGQIIGYCMWVAFGVVEEKSSRVIELILSSVSSKALLAGKIFGIGLLGLLQLALIVTFGLGLGSTTGALEVSADYLVPVGSVIVWFILGYAFYSALFAATAARVSRQEELQNIIGPLNMIIMVSFFATFYVNANPTSMIGQVLGVLPPFSALAAPVRMAQGVAPWWESGLALLLMLVAIAALISVGGRIYDGAVLRTGAKVSLKEAWASARS